VPVYLNKSFAPVGAHFVRAVGLPGIALRQSLCSVPSERQYWSQTRKKLDLLDREHGVSVLRPYRTDPGVAACDMGLKQTAMI